LKRSTEREARRLGATLVGFAPVERWDEFGEVPEDYRPRAIWDQARTVIVLGVPMLLPVIESTPSINYQEQYNTSNILLDQMSYRLALYLNGMGQASIQLPRDGYGNLGILLKKMPASFSHVFAAKYAGLGTIGYSHNLLTREYGPRVRLVSVFTKARLAATPLVEGELCKQCRLCGRLCPVQSFQPAEGRVAAEYDPIACTKHHQELVSENRWPCGTCAKVCMVGEDRKLYGRPNVAEYLHERKAIEENPRDPRYRHLVHLRTHGSDGERLY